jgi:hypothetical protein
VNGKVHHFGVVGAANGVSIMTDKKTGSIWDSISGEAFNGPLKGSVLDTYPVFITTVTAETKIHDGTRLFFSTFKSPKMFLLGLISKPLLGVQKRGFIPPHFFKSMSAPIDQRLPKLEQGLGVIVDKRAKYYPISRIPRDRDIHEDWNGREMVIIRSSEDGIPHAFWRGSGDLPMQLLSRWYGFAFSYPDCDIFEFTQ